MTLTSAPLGESHAQTACHLISTRHCDNVRGHACRSRFRQIGPERRSVSRCITEAKGTTGLDRGRDSGRGSEPAWYEGNRLTVRLVPSLARLRHKGSNMMDVVQVSWRSQCFSGLRLWVCMGSVCPNGTERLRGQHRLDQATNSSPSCGLLRRQATPWRGTKASDGEDGTNRPFGPTTLLSSAPSLARRLR